MECCKKRAINNPCFIGVEKRLADGRRAMNTTHIMNLRIGLGRSDRYEKQKARNTLRPFMAEPFPRFLPHGCFYAAATEKYTGCPFTIHSVRRDIHSG